MSKANKETYTNILEALQSTMDANGYTYQYYFSSLAIFKEDNMEDIIDINYNSNNKVNKCKVTLMSNNKELINKFKDIGGKLNANKHYIVTLKDQQSTLAFINNKLINIL